MAARPAFHQLQLRGVFLFGLLVSTVWAAGCDKVPLLAPTGATITLAATNQVIPIGGTTNIIATVIESSGTPVHNGTVVTFSTTLGSIEPVEARTENGLVTVRLYAGNRSGTAVVRAFSGGASATGDASVELTIGSAGAERVVLTASNTVVGINGGTVALTASVSDVSNNPIPNAPVLFTATAGTLTPTQAFSDENGIARATLSTNAASTVSASVGAKTSNQVSITTVGQPTISITAPTTTIFTDQPATFTVNATAPTGLAVANVTIIWDDGTADSLGNPTGSTTITHIYRRAFTYRVTASVRDSSGQTSQVTTTVVVQDRAPLVLTLTASDLNPVIQTVVTFRVTGTQAGQTVPIVATDWDFGDGQLHSGQQSAEITHPYGTTGHKVVRVTAYTAERFSAEARLDLIVRPSTTTPGGGTTPLPLPPSGVWPTTGPAVVAYAQANFASYLAAGVTAAQRASNVTFVRDRMIEAGRCGGMDLAWNLKRGGPEISIDYMVHRANGQDLGVDFAVAYEDTSRPVQLQWNITAIGTAQSVFYGGYTSTFACR